MRNFEIIAISNKYENILNKLIDNSDAKSLDWPQQIDKRLWNALKSKNNLIELLEKDYLDNNILDIWLIFKIKNSQRY